MDVNARKRWSVALVFAVVAWFLMSADPLGIEEATADRSSRFMFRVAAPFYTGSGHVVVVLIDEQFLNGTQWPPSYRQQGQLLRRIMQFNPSAVFLDLLYSAPHSSAVKNPIASGTPEDLLSGISEDMYPRIYMAALTHDGTCNREERGDTPGTEILNKHGMVDEIVGRLPDRNLLAVSWSGCGDSYPLLLSKDGYARTPAYALYREYCKIADPSSRKKCSESARDDEFQTPMTIRWGAFAPAAQMPFYAAGVCQQYADASGQVPFGWRMWAATKQFFVAMVNGLDAVTSAEMKLPCPAIAVLPAAAFNAPTNAAKYQELERLLSGNLVLIGAKVPGVPDSEVSPVHGLVSGAEIHGMALDNLLMLHDRYARATLGEWMQRAVDLVVLILVAVLIVFFSDAQPGETWVDSTLPILGAAFWALYATFWCWHGDWALAVFGLLGWACLDYFRADATAEVVLHFVLVCSIAMLALWLGIPTRNFVVLALTAAGLFAAVHARLSDQSPHNEQPNNSLLRKYVLPHLHFGAKRNPPSSSERSPS